MSPRRRNRSGFSLIEVLVVLGIILVLVTIVATVGPTLREASRNITCLSNMKQLSFAWFNYQIDNQRMLVGGHTVREFDWVQPGNTDAATKAGLLYPYIETTRPYKCPTDPKPNLRTYSVIGPMNGEGFGLEPILYFNQILNPGQQLVFMEEWDYRGSYNNGSWVMFIDNYRWIDYLVPWHRYGDTNNLGFADGHAEQWKWTDPDTLVPLTYAEQGNFAAFFFTDPGNQDWERLAAAYYNVRR